jgi:hypothetical protein
MGTASMLLPLVGIFTGRAIGQSMATEGWMPAGGSARLAVTPSRMGGAQVGLSIPR